MSDWQPIETAPKDGTFVDLWTTDQERVCNAWWVNDTNPPGWHADHMDYLDCGPVEVGNCKATHWMPVPTAPEVKS